MDPFSGATAAVSLALQLTSTVHSVRQFLQNIQDAPKEIAAILEITDQLNGHLKAVARLSELQHPQQQTPISSSTIEDALKSCEKRVKTLEAIANRLRESFCGSGRLRNSWASVRVVLKKEDIQHLQVQMRDSVQALQTALMISSIERLHLLSCVAVIDEPAGSIGPPRPFVDSDHKATTMLKCSAIRLARCHNNTSIVTKTDTRILYSGILGMLCILKNRRCIKNHEAPGNAGELTVATEKVIRVRPTFLGYTVELSFAAGFCGVPRSLKVYHVIGDEMLWLAGILMHGDLGSFQRALVGYGMSPFVIDSEGTTLLHKAAHFCRADVCMFLIGLGLSRDRTDNRGSIPFIGAAYDCDWSSSDEIVDTFRVLVQAQECVSRNDLSRFLVTYRACPGGIDFLLSKGLFDTDGFWPLLRTVLAFLGQDSEWEPVVRRVLRQGKALGVNITDWVLDWRNYAETDYYVDDDSPIEALFRRIKFPPDAEEAAQHWLGILDSEGYDVREYLEEEKRWCDFKYEDDDPYLHPLPMRQRVVVEVHREPLTAYWIWWTDPQSSVYLLLEEFQSLYGAFPTLSIDLSDWPYHCSTEKWGWYDHHREADRDTKRIKKWSKRHMKKDGKNKGHAMPGAWPR